MKLHTALLLGALITIPGVALAQDATPAATAVPATAPAAPAHAWGHRPDPAKMKAMMAKMHATMKQLETLRKAERTAMLGDLSSAHRAYLASVVGNLAVANDPNPKAAVAAIDAKLTASEKANVLATQKSYQVKMKAVLAAAFKGMPHRRPDVNPGGPMKHNGPMQHGSMHGHSRHHHTVTAGMLLLAQTGFGGHHGFGGGGFGMMHRPMMGHGPMGHGQMGRGGWTSHGPHGQGGPGPVVAPDAPVTPVPAPTATP